MTTNCIHGIHIEGRCRECEAMDNAVAADEQAKTSTPQQQYIQWLDKEIKKLNEAVSDNLLHEQSHISQKHAFYAAKGRFITLFQIKDDEPLQS